MSEQAIENAPQSNILGTEPVGKLLIKLAIPAIAAQIVNMLYNIVDRMFIAQYVGTEALAGVGVTFPIIILIAAFASLIGMGGSPRASIKMGQDRYEEANEILSNCFITLLGISVVLTVVFTLFAEELLLMFGASAETLPYGLEYIGIYVLGTIFVQITFGLNTFISCQGFAKTSMQTIFIGAGLNIVLDFILITIFDMGVKGAAIATVTSQFVSAIWVLMFLMKSKKSKLKIEKKYFKLKKSVMFPVLALGISPFVMQSTESLLNIAFNSSLREYGGDIAVTSMTILATVMQCINLPTMGIAQGAIPIISFNYGAGNKDRIKKAFKLLLISALTFTTTIWLIILIKPEVFIGIFIKPGDPVLEYASTALKVYLFAAFAMGAQLACQQTFIALGQAKASLMLAILRKIVLLIPLIYLLPNILPQSFLTSINSMLAVDLGNEVLAVFLSEPIADFIAAVCTVTLFMFVSKKVYKQMDEKKKIV